MGYEKIQRGTKNPRVNSRGRTVFDNNTIVRDCTCSFYRCMAGLPIFVRGPFFIVASLFITLGLLFSIWSVWAQFVIAEETPIPVMPTRKLVVKGPYAYCRNPMILGNTIFYLGIGIMYGSFFCGWVDGINRRNAFDIHKTCRRRGT